MAPKGATRSTPVTTTAAPTATTTTSVTNAQLQTMIDQGVTAALAARDANRNADDSHTSGIGGRRTKRVVQECTYQDFMKCKPLYFKGTDHDAAYAMTWADLRKKMTDKYCPRNKMKKLEAELWNLKLKEESDKIERYVGELPDMIHRNIVASKPKTMQEAVEMATELMDKKVSTIAERQAENKRGYGLETYFFVCGVQGQFKREYPKLKNNKEYRGEESRLVMTGSQLIIVGGLLGTCWGQTQILNSGVKGVCQTTTGSFLLGELRLVCQERKVGSFRDVHSLQGRSVYLEVRPKVGLSQPEVREEDIPLRTRDRLMKMNACAEPVLATYEISRRRRIGLGV
ncbi:hypothetical protein Tco_0738928 [Tanacetum coccineum]